MLLIVQPGSEIFHGASLLALLRRVLLRRVPDPDAACRRRGPARVAVLSGARSASSCMTPLLPVPRTSVPNMPLRDALLVARRTARHARPLPVHPRVPARAGVRAHAVHVHAARLGDAGRLGRVRRSSRRLVDGRHGAHRRQRPAAWRCTSDGARAMRWRRPASTVTRYRSLASKASGRAGSAMHAHYKEAQRMNKPRIGFIGVGLMGHGIAKNLVTKGFPLTRARASQSRAGRRPPRRGCEGSEDDRRRRARVRHRVPVRDRRAAGRGESCSARTGIASAAREGLDRHRHVDERAGDDDQDARSAGEAGRAVRRRAARAHAGRGGAGPAQHHGRRRRRDVRRDSSPCSSAFCENIFHAGPAGHGIILKLINNFIAQAICTATAEACAAAAKSGLSISKLHEVISAGAVNSGLFQMLVGKMLESGDLTGPQVHAGRMRRRTCATTRISPSR